MDNTDKLRYSVQPFSSGMVGVWDNQAQDFVKNPKSGRRKLFHRQTNAEKLAVKLNSACKPDTGETESHA